MVGVDYMTDKTKICPYCGEEILATAKKCKHCKEWINNNITKEDYNKNIDKYIWLITIAIVIFIPMPFGMACFVGFLGGIIGHIIKETQKKRIS